jgi:hypothetical protein
VVVARRLRRKKRFIDQGPRPQCDAQRCLWDDPTVEPRISCQLYAAVAFLRLTPFTAGFHREKIRERQILTAKVKPRFIEPMLLLRTEMLPEGPEWGYEIKLDGYRALAFKTGGKLSLRSRNDNDFALRCPSILACSPALQAVDEPQILAHRVPLL